MSDLVTYMSDLVTYMSQDCLEQSQEVEVTAVMETEDADELHSIGRHQ